MFVMLHVTINITNSYPSLEVMLKWQFSVLSYQSQLQFSVAVAVSVSVSVAVAVFSLQYSVCSHSIQFTVRGIVTFSFNFAPLRLCEKIFMDLSETQYSVFSLQFSVAVAVASKNPCIFVWLREPLRNN